MNHESPDWNWGRQAPTTPAFWPDVFITGQLPDRSEYDSETQKALACADGLTGWALCHMGNEPPDQFGKGMVAIGLLLGINATGENLSKYADRINKKFGKKT